MFEILQQIEYRYLSLCVNALNIRAIPMQKTTVMYNGLRFESVDLFNKVEVYEVQAIQAYIPYFVLFLRNESDCNMKNMSQDHF